MSQPTASTEKPLTWSVAAVVALTYTAAIVTGVLIWGATHPDPRPPLPPPEPTGCRETTSNKYESACLPGQTLAIEPWGGISVVVCHCPKYGGAP